MRMPPAEGGGGPEGAGFCGGAVSFAAVTGVAAQPVANSRRLVIVNVSAVSHSQMREDGGNYYRVLFAELRRLGQIEGQNLTVERYGKEQYLQTQPHWLRR